MHYTPKHYIFIEQRSKMQTTITKKILPQILKGFETFFIHFGTFAKNIFNGKRFSRVSKRFSFFLPKIFIVFGFETLRNTLKLLKNYTNGFKVLRGFDRFENVTKLEVSKGYFHQLILSFFRFV